MGSDTGVKNQIQNSLSDRQDSIFHQSFPLRQVELFTALKPLSQKQTSGSTRDQLSK